MNSTRVVMLGTGTPNCEGDRAGAAVAIVVDGVPYIVDCGAGVVRRAAAAGIAIDRLERLFITHLHSDHTIGYADIILSPAVLGRRGALAAFGPPGLSAMTDHLLAAYKEDIEERCGGLERGNREAYQVDVHEIEPGEIYHDEQVRVEAFRVHHGSWKHAYGFRFETADRVIVISGDTVPCAELIEKARGCDVLAHEVYSKAGFDRRSPEWQKYHRNAHTSAVELAEIARQVQPGLLVLTHVLLWGVSAEDLIREIKEGGYGGKVVMAQDLGVY